LLAGDETDAGGSRFRIEGFVRRSTDRGERRGASEPQSDTTRRTRPASPSS